MDLREELMQRHGREKVLEDEGFTRLKRLHVQRHGLSSLHFYGCRGDMSNMHECGQCGVELVKVGFSTVHPGSPLHKLWESR